MSNVIYIQSESGNAKATISLHGATILSWLVNSKECIFLSKLANASNPVPGKGIRGGIPIVFPNFGPWECGPQHGFARGKIWNCVENTKQKAILELDSDEETKTIWNHEFKLKYQVTITGNSLETSLTVNNLGSDPFDFTALLHTYLRVPDVRDIKISGFEKRSYHDSLTKENRDGIDGDINGIYENVDRVYSGTVDVHHLKFHNTVIKIDKTNLPDTVLWNPWEEKAKGMKDFGDEEFTEMVCIEAGKVSERQIVQPLMTWCCKQVLTVEDLS